MVTDRSQCAGLNRQGEPCGMPPLRGGSFCWNHAPEKAEARARARTKGAHRKHSRSGVTAPSNLRLRTVEDVTALIEQAGRVALSLPDSSNKARTIASIAGIALKCVEVGELEARLRVLEQTASGGGSNVGNA